MEIEMYLRFCTGKLNFEWASFVCGKRGRIRGISFAKFDTYAAPAWLICDNKLKIPTRNIARIPRIVRMLVSGKNRASKTFFSCKHETFN